MFEGLVCKVLLLRTFIYFLISSSLVSSLDFLFKVFFQVFFLLVFLYRVCFLSSFSLCFGFYFYFFIRVFFFKILIISIWNFIFIFFSLFEQWIFLQILTPFQILSFFKVMMKYCITWIKEVIMFFRCDCIACNSLILQLIRDGGEGPCNLWTKLHVIKMSWPQCRSPQHCSRLLQTLMSESLKS